MKHKTRRALRGEKLSLVVVAQRAHPLNHLKKWIAGFLVYQTFPFALLPKEADGFLDANEYLASARIAEG